MSKYRDNKRLVAYVLLPAVLSMIALVWSLTGCDDKPTEPKPQEEELKDYAVYMVEGSNPGWIYAYHPLTNVLDSFYWPTDLQVIVSADGRTLYGRPDGSSTSAAVSLDSVQCGDTLVVDHTLPFVFVAAVSPDNQLLAVVYTDGSWSIVRTSDYSEVFRDTANIGLYSRFTPDSRGFYGLGAHVDLNSTPPTISRWSCPYGRFDYLVPSEDEAVWYLMVAISGFCDFLYMVYDPGADSVLFYRYLTPGLGHIELAPDGRVFFTNPGTGPFVICEASPHPYLYIYDPETNAVNDSICTRGYCSLAPSIAELVITPDKRWLVGIHPGNGVILTVNLETMQVEKCRTLGSGRSLCDLSCQQML